MTKKKIKEPEQQLVVAEESEWEDAEDENGNSLPLLSSGEADDFKIPDLTNLTELRGMYDFAEAPSREYDPDTGEPDIELYEQDEEEKALMRNYRIGKMGVFGQEGSGKGVFLAWLARFTKMFWPTRTLITDYPLEATFERKYGKYTLVDPESMMEFIIKTEELAKKKIKDFKTEEEKQDWTIDGLANYGIVLRNSVMELDEFDVWANNRRSGSKVNDMIQGIFKRHRHYKILIVGACPDEHDLDKRVAPRLNYKVYCSPVDSMPDHFFYEFVTVSGMGIAGIRRISESRTFTLYGRPIYPLFWTDAPTAVISRTVGKKSFASKGKN
jgi:hypothetical protein